MRPPRIISQIETHKKSNELIDPNRIRSEIETNKINLNQTRFAIKKILSVRTDPNCGL